MVNYCEFGERVHLVERDQSFPAFPCSSQCE
jgi:hypothetical protein